MKASFIVSLHDVSPLTRCVFTPMLDELDALGVARCSLLVIPDHHHRGHMLDDADFCRWLEHLALQGHELVVHGYYHQREKRAGETWRQRYMTRVYTTGEGEFYDLPKARATERLAQAKADFRRLDAPEPVGFIAPAWLLGAEADEAVREAGFRYTTRLTEVEKYESGQPGFIHARSLVYSPRNAWRRACSLAWNAALARHLRAAPLLRLGLHPPDYRLPNIWRQVRRIIRDAVRVRAVQTYRELVDGQRPT